MVSDVGESWPVLMLRLLLATHAAGSGATSLATPVGGHAELVSLDRGMLSSHTLCV